MIIRTRVINPTEHVRVEYYLSAGVGFTAIKEQAQQFTGPLEIKSALEIANQSMMNDIYGTWTYHVEPT